MSSYQTYLLPPGYSHRIATKNDVARILYFELFDHESNAIYSVLILFFLMFIILNEIRQPVIMPLVFFWFMFVPYYVYCYLKYYRYIETGLLKVWMVEFMGNTRGYLVIKELDEYIFITTLLIRSSHRRNGLGRYLISHIRNTMTKPAYLVCHTNLKSFYYRHGFSDVDYSTVPIELLEWRSYRHSSLMVSRVENQI